MVYRQPSLNHPSSAGRRNPSSSSPEQDLFWVQIYNIPVGLFSEDIGRTLGNFIGNFMEYDSSNKGATWKPFMRIWVELDVGIPLKKGKKIRLGSGEPSTVIFKYERLQFFCFICGKLGHTESMCDKLFDSNVSDISKNWGPFLKAPDRRNLPNSGDKWLRDYPVKDLGRTSIGQQEQVEEVSAAPNVKSPLLDPQKDGTTTDNGKNKDLLEVPANSLENIFEKDFSERQS